MIGYTQYTVALLDIDGDDATERFAFGTDGVVNVESSPKKIINIYGRVIYCHQQRVRVYSSKRTVDLRRPYGTTLVGTAVKWAPTTCSTASACLRRRATGLRRTCDV